MTSPLLGDPAVDLGSAPGRTRSGQTFYLSFATAEDMEEGHGRPGRVGESVNKGPTLGGGAKRVRVGSPLRGGGRSGGGSDVLRTPRRGGGAGGGVRHRETRRRITSSSTGRRFSPSSTRGAGGGPTCACTSAPSVGPQTDALLGQSGSASTPDGGPGCRGGFGHRATESCVPSGTDGDSNTPTLHKRGEVHKVDPRRREEESPWF